MTKAPREPLKRGPRFACRTCGVSTPGGHDVPAGCVKALKARWDLYEDDLRFIAEKRDFIRASLRGLVAAYPLLALQPLAEQKENDMPKPDPGSGFGHPHYEAMMARTIPMTTPKEAPMKQGQPQEANRDEVVAFAIAAAMREKERADELQQVADFRAREIESFATEVKRLEADVRRLQAELDEATAPKVDTVTLTTEQQGDLALLGWSSGGK